jgi:hypothetical protein
MADPNENGQLRMTLKESFKVPLEKFFSLEHMTEQTGGLMFCASALDKALRAYYNQHQANGCECELCITAEGALAFRVFSLAK